MTDIKQFRENARKDGLCAEYSAKWDKCANKKQLMDLCLEVKGLDYVCDSVAKGWGISSDYICEKFQNFNDGKYVFDNGKYTSKMYCKCNYEEVVADTTALLVIDSVIDIDLPKFCICEIYVTGKSLVTLHGEGEAAVICYGDEIELIADEGIHYKVIHKKDKDKYE